MHCSLARIQFIVLSTETLPSSQNHEAFTFIQPGKEWAVYLTELLGADISSLHSPDGCTLTATTPGNMALVMTPTGHYCLGDKAVRKDRWHQDVPTLGTFSEQAFNMQHLLLLTCNPTLSIIISAN